MKKVIVLLVLVVLIGGCASAEYITRNVRDSNPIGQTYYTKVNIWYTNPKEIFANSLLLGSILPIGTKVEILRCKGREIKFSVNSSSAFINSGSTFSLVLYRKSIINMTQLFDRYFTKEDTMAEDGAFFKLTLEEQKSVKSGEINYGMNKETVLMTYGYPPDWIVPDPKLSNFWEYNARDKRWRIYFEDNKISKIEQVKFGVRIPFVGRKEKVTEKKNTERTNLVSLGMTKAQVIKVMGIPASSKGEFDKEILEYILYPTVDLTWKDREYFWVTLENGKVIQYGRAGDFGSAMPTDRREYDIKIQNK
ncbi:MAG: DUF2845 domain-containing protein [Candidatus Omnitrophica bacterium]|nr:DUF2845 domain-containing protein [Candidatus Omnitrophota bacterium]